MADNFSARGLLYGTSPTMQTGQPPKEDDPNFADYNGLGGTPAAQAQATRNAGVNMGGGSIGNPGGVLWQSGSDPNLDYGVGPGLGGGGANPPDFGGMRGGDGMYAGGVGGVDYSLTGPGGVATDPVSSGRAGGDAYAGGVGGVDYSLTGPTGVSQQRNPYSDATIGIVDTPGQMRGGDGMQAGGIGGPGYSLTGPTPMDSVLKQGTVRGGNQYGPQTGIVKPTLPPSTMLPGDNVPSKIATGYDDVRNFDAGPTATASNGNISGRAAVYGTSVGDPNTNGAPKPGDPNYADYNGLGSTDAAARQAQRNAGVNMGGGAIGNPTYQTTGEDVDSRNQAGRQTAGGGGGPGYSLTGPTQPGAGGTPTGTRSGTQTGLPPGAPPSGTRSGNQYGPGTGIVPPTRTGEHPGLPPELGGGGGGYRPLPNPQVGQTTGNQGTDAVDNPPGYTASQAGTSNSISQGYDATKWNVTPEQQVENRLARILGSGSPLMTQAETQAKQAANARGLLNSSMAVTAGQDAMIRSALPIAQQDAQTNANAAQFSAGADNSAKAFTASAANESSKLNAQLGTQVNLNNSGEQNKAAAFTASAKNARDASAAEIASKEKLALWDSNTKQNIAQLGSDTEKQLALWDSNTKQNIAQLNANTQSLMAQWGEDTKRMGLDVEMNKAIMSQGLQMNQSAAAMQNQFAQIIANIQNRTDMDAQAKIDAMNTQLDIFRRGLDTIGNISGFYLGRYFAGDKFNMDKPGTGAAGPGGSGGGGSGPGSGDPANNFGGGGAGGGGGD